MRGYPADPDKDYRHSKEAWARLRDPGQSAEGWDKRVWDEVQMGEGHADRLKEAGAGLTDIQRAQVMGSGVQGMAAGQSPLEQRAALAAGSTGALAGLGQAGQARLRSDVGAEQMRVGQWKTGIGALLGQQGIESKRYGIEKGAATSEEIHQKELDRMEDDFWFGYGANLLGGGLGGVGALLGSDEGMKKKMYELGRADEQRAINAIVAKKHPQVASAMPPLTDEDLKPVVNENEIEEGPWTGKENENLLLQEVFPEQRWGKVPWEERYGRSRSLGSAGLREESVYSPDEGGRLHVYTGSRGQQRAAFLRPVGEEVGPWQGFEKPILPEYVPPGPVSPGTAPMTNIGSSDSLTLVGSDERLKSKVAELTSELNQATSEKEEIQRIAREAMGRRPFSEERPLQRVAREAESTAYRAGRAPRLRGGEEGTEYFYEGNPERIGSGIDKIDETPVSQHVLNYLQPQDEPALQSPGEWWDEARGNASDFWGELSDERLKKNLEKTRVERDAYKEALGLRVTPRGQETEWQRGNREFKEGFHGMPYKQPPQGEWEKRLSHGVPIFDRGVRTFEQGAPKLEQWAEKGLSKVGTRAGMEAEAASAYRSGIEDRALSPSDIGDVAPTQRRPGRQRWGNPMDEVIQKTPLLEYEYNEQAQRDYGMPPGRRVGTSANRLRSAGPLGKNATALGPRGEVMIKPDQGIGLALGISAKTGRENQTQDAQLHDLAVRLARLEHGSEW